MMLSNNQKAFLSLVKAGLWEEEVSLLQFGDIEFDEIYRLAQEQSVVGLVAAGIGRVVDMKVPQDIALQMAGEVLQLDQRNKAMNAFVARLIETLRKADVSAILVKGQGVAQCYERPLWRVCGDVDLLLDNNNYVKAIKLLSPMADKVIDDTVDTMHYSIILDNWEVELHGTLHGNISDRIDAVIDSTQNKSIGDGEVRTWTNGGVDIFLPSPDNDIIFIFSHILQHFFLGGIGLRQFCDLARLLWIFKEEINEKKLDTKLSGMEVRREWKAFGCVLVDVLGLKKEAMPFYETTYSKKTEKILKYIFEVGNFGHNKDNSYQAKTPPIKRKLRTFTRQAIESFRLMNIFPRTSIVSLYNYWIKGTKDVIFNEQK